MTILVTGANGQLGNEMRIVSKGSKDKYIFTDVCDEHPESIEMLHKLAGDDVDITTTKLDITNLDAIRAMVKENDVKVIVNCAAWTNVDGAEDPDKRELVELLNAKAPENLAIAIKEVNGLLVHISTDYVFGGDPYNTPCKEDQKGTPTGVYGLTKLYGEQNIQATGVNHLIFRTAWLYSEFGKNFVKTMLNLTATKPQLKVVFDQVGTPTYALDLANAIVVAIEDYKAETSNRSTLTAQRYSKSGVYHFSNEGVCSWYDFTKMIQEIAVDLSGSSTLTDNRSPLNCQVLPCHSDEFVSPVKRPAFSVLDKTKVKGTFGIKVPYWIDSLRKCISLKYKFILISISLLFGTCHLFAQSEVLTIEKNEGVIVSYSFDTHPRVTFDESYLRVSTDITEVSYPLSEVKRYLITKSDEPFNSRDIIIDEDELSSFLNASEISDCNIVYKRTFDDTEWQSLYVPFDIDISCLNEDFDVAVINNFHQYDDDNDGTFDRTVLEIKKVTGRKTLMANYPYLIKAKETGEKTIMVPGTILYPTELYSIDCSSVELKYTFTGTYETISDLRTADYWILRDGRLEKSYSNKDILPLFRWYMSITPRGEQFKNNPIIVQARSIEIKYIDETVSVDEIHESNTLLQFEAYRLDGSKISNLSKGLYIMKMHDGSYRKVMVK